MQAALPWQNPRFEKSSNSSHTWRSHLGFARDKRWRSSLHVLILILVLSSVVRCTLASGRWR